MHRCCKPRIRKGNNMSEVQVFQTQNPTASSFVHLHVHTDFSLKSGSSNINSLVNKAKTLNMKYLAITDINNLIGSLDFEKICKLNGITPIIGEEIVVCDEEDFYNIVLLCKDSTGYKNLSQLSGITYSKKYTAKKHFVTLDDLRTFSEGLFCLSGGKTGAFFSLFKQNDFNAIEKRACTLRKIFRENFYFELQNHSTTEEQIFSKTLYELGQRIHIQSVVTNEVDYCDRTDAEANAVLTSIRSRTPYSSNAIKSEAYLKSEQEMKNLFPDYSDAINNTNYIASKCNLTIPAYTEEKFEDLLPQIVPPKDFCLYKTQKENQQELMRRLVNAGLKNRYKYISDKIRERADAELQLIFEKDFTNYLLMIWEYVSWAKERDIIVGPGKGPVIESIVAYALGITAIDPLKYNLPFERFINEDTTVLPNIDIEFGAEKISRIMQHLKVLYGEKKVANIIEIEKYSNKNLKNLIEDIGHTLNINSDEIRILTDKLPRGNFISLSDAFTPASEFTPSNGQLIPYKNDLRYTKLFELAAKLEGNISAFTIHPSGVVISKADLCTLVPICSDSKTEELVTQYTVDNLKSRGIHVFNFIDSLIESFVRRCEDIIIKNHPGDKFNLEKIPLYDSKTFNFFSSGKTDDIPGFEFSNAQDILRSIKPSTFEELTALFTMNRPEQFNQIQNFINRKENPSLVEYPDLSLKPILQETYGIVIYQEQMMYCLQKLSGKSLSEVNKLRELQNQPRNESYEKLRSEFITGISDHGFDQETAERLFNRISMTATFGYLKAEAIAYTKTSYQIAWIKVHYPEEFLSSKNTTISKHWWENYYLEF